MADKSTLIKDSEGNMIELKLIELNDGTYAVAVVDVTTDKAE